ncbi:hypothetical protein R3P38DRAFT_3175230 [Favolaschia claudopus]|uniref:Uncharacterized protein n=1 Tax=Favolaschia claudopus TaxID=2862362 RepID=A0AAW0DCD7_9AGAR
MLERIWKKLAAENREYTGHSAATFLSPERASLRSPFAWIHDACSIRTHCLRIRLPITDGLFSFALALHSFISLLAPTLDSVLLARYAHIALKDTDLSPTVFTLSRLGFTLFCPRPASTLSCRRTRPSPAVLCLYLFDTASEVLAFHSFVIFPNPSLSNVPGLYGFPIALSFKSPQAISALIRRRAFAIRRSSPHVRSILLVFTARSPLRISILHSDIRRNAFEFSLSQRSLAHMGSILLVLYFGFVENKSIARLCNHTGNTSTLAYFLLLYCVLSFMFSSDRTAQSHEATQQLSRFVLVFRYFCRCRALNLLSTRKLSVMFVSPSLAGTFRSSDEFCGATGLASANLVRLVDFRIFAYLRIAMRASYC